MINTKSTFNNNNTRKAPQNLWCRPCYAEHIITVIGFKCFKETNGCQLRKCQYSATDCRGAHTADAIKPLKHISTYNRLDKSKYDWVSLYFGVIESFKKDSIKLIDKDHISKVSKFISEDSQEEIIYNFIDAIKLWRDLSCIYRKIQKEIPFKHAGHAGGNTLLPSRAKHDSNTLLPSRAKHDSNSVQTHLSGYKYSNDVPTFYLNGALEDVAWPFERILRDCQTHKKVQENLNKRQQITIWDLCLATGLNCKEGVHHQDERLCTDNFLTGTCSCQTQESIDTREVELQLKKLDLITKLTALVKNKDVSSSSDNWQSSKLKGKKSKALDPKQELEKQIQNVNQQINYLSTLQRMIHYTEQGMTPFNEQLQKYYKDKKEFVEPTVIKASWDHEITKEIATVATTPAVKIIKLGKLGKKK
jgi:hypothetical protein